MLPPAQCSDAAALTLTAEETTTPELECLGAASQDPPQSGAGGTRSGEQEATTAQALFPIFRPRNQRKCILLVRHGESSASRVQGKQPMIRRGSALSFRSHRSNSLQAWPDVDSVAIKLSSSHYPT